MNQRSIIIVRTGALAFLALATGMLFLGGCTTARIPVTGLEVPVPDIPLPAVLRGEKDLRGRPWSKAFLIMHERLVREYAYTDLKDIDWAARYQETAAKVIEAQEARDRDAWYRAIRAYIHSIPDGNLHVDVNETIRDAEVGASAGLALVQLADDSVIVCGLVEAGPAALAGIEWGATVLKWEKKPIAEALAGTNTIWADNPAATPAMERLHQLAWLPRGPEGESRSLTYMNPGDEKPRKATLTLAADGYATLDLGRPLWRPVDLFGSPVDTRPLDGDYRYIDLIAIAPTLGTPFPVRDFKGAVRKAVTEEAPGVIIDLRGTQGGDGALVPKMLECLVAEETFFEIPSVWDSGLETYLAKTEQMVRVTPEEPVYTGPLVVLVDAYTMGPAESLAGFLKGRPNVKIYGMAGTGASPGVPEVELTLPGGYAVMYPDRRALDEAGNVQGASDGEGTGGVAPDNTFALDRSSAEAIYRDGEDAVLNKAVELLDSSTWRFP